MLPGLESGDLVVAFDQETYAVGDVIVYRVPSAEPGAGTQIVHRVVGHAAGDGYIVRGDNREGPDYWRPAAEEVVGKMQLRLPGVGTALVYMRTTFGLALIAALTTILVALGVFSEPIRKTKPDRAHARRKPVRPRIARPAPVSAGPASSAWTRGLVIDARIPEANGSRGRRTQPRRALRARRAPARPAG
jgi:signal peptidase